jgi:DNA ligase D-like protein (predicted ligase)
MRTARISARIAVRQSRFFPAAFAFFQRRRAAAAIRSRAAADIVRSAFLAGLGCVEARPLFTDGTGTSPASAAFMAIKRDCSASRSRASESRTAANFCNESFDMAARYTGAVSTEASRTWASSSFPCYIPPMPSDANGFIPPMLLRLVPHLPIGKQWQYEVKWDGYRAIAIVKTGTARLISRNEKDMSARFPQIIAGLGKLKVTTATLDGEIVVLNEDGKPDFEALQYFDPRKARNVFYYAFDLLELNGRDLKKLPLVERRKQLQRVLADPPPVIRFSNTLEGEPSVLIEAVKGQGLEGIVAKDRNATYESGKRSGKWQKFKLYQEEEFVIGGFIPDGKDGVESVVLGVPEGKKLRYVACLNVHLPREASRAAATKLIALKTATSPFGEIQTRKPGNSWSGGMTSGGEVGRCLGEAEI